MTGNTEAPDLLNASDDDLKAMGLPPAFTLAELQAALSDEEIAKLAEGDDPIITLPDTNKSKPAPDEEDTDDDDPDDDEDGEGEGEGDKGEAEDGDKPAEAAAPDETPDPVYQPVDASEAKATIEGAAAERKALRDSYDDGELTDEEYDAKLAELADKIVDAKVQVRDAEKANAEALDAYRGAWFSKVEAFQEANPAFKDNKPRPELQGDSYLTALDKVLVAINQDARYAGMSMSQRIDAGAQIVRAYVKKQTGADIPGSPEGGKKAKPAAADPLDKARAEAARAGKRPDPVQTLGNVTAATETGTDSRFAAIDREASALDREREFNRLSPEEQDAFLSGY